MACHYQHEVYHLCFVYLHRYAVVQTRQVYWANQRSAAIAERRKYIDL